MTALHCAPVQSRCSITPTRRAGRSRWTNHAVEKAHGFSLFEFAIFETCLLSLGLWLGTCFSKFFKKLRTLFFVAFAATWLYMLWRIFFDEEE